MLGKLALCRIRERRTPLDGSAFAADVLRYASFRLGSIEDAEDVVAHVLRDAARRRETAELSNPRLFLIGVARRRVTDVLRRRGRTLRVRSIDDPSFIPPSSDGDFEAVSRRLMVAGILRRLPDAEREVLALKYLHDLSAEEIAGLIDRSVPAVNSLLQRARRSFAETAGDTFEPQ